MYDKDLLAPLALLHGSIIKNVYYYTLYEGWVYYNQIDHIEEIPFLGLLIETDDNNFFSIHEFDCSPNYDLGGLRVIPRNYIHRGDRPNQIESGNWVWYKNKKIISTKIFDIGHRYLDNEIVVVPLGICLNFEGDEALFIMNVHIEEYNQTEHKYAFIQGQNIVLFFTMEAIEKYNLLVSATARVI